MKVGGPVAGIGDKMSVAVSAGVRRFSPAVTEADVPPGRMISVPGRGSTFVSTAGELSGPGQRPRARGDVAHLPRVRTGDGLLPPAATAAFAACAHVTADVARRRLG